MLLRDVGRFSGVGCTRQPELAIGARDQVDLGEDAVVVAGLRLVHDAQTRHDLDTTPKRPADDGGLEREILKVLQPLGRDAAALAAERTRTVLLLVEALGLDLSQVDRVAALGEDVDAHHAPFVFEDGFEQIDAIRSVQKASGCLGGGLIARSAHLAAVREKRPRDRLNHKAPIGE
jgi:hypothetical protein